MDSSCRTTGVCFLKEETENGMGEVAGADTPFYFCLFFPDGCRSPKEEKGGGVEPAAG